MSSAHPMTAFHLLHPPGHQTPKNLDDTVAIVPARPRQPQENRERVHGCTPKRTNTPVLFSTYPGSVQSARIFLALDCSDLCIPYSLFSAKPVIQHILPTSTQVNARMQQSSCNACVREGVCPAGCRDTSASTTIEESSGGCRHVSAVKAPPGF